MGAQTGSRRVVARSIPVRRSGTIRLGAFRRRGEPVSHAVRRAGTSREEADRAVAQKEIHELPAARGGTFVVPQSDFALALRCGRDAAKIPIKAAAKLGVTEKEIDTLCAAILSALRNGPQDPDGLREASRSLGPEGVKKGMTTTLPLGLGKLQSMGQIRRVPVNGRLDQQRY